ncbi:MAG: hypothetical protein AB7V48_03320 [Sedimentibacter sp.]
MKIKKSVILSMSIIALATAAYFLNVIFAHDKPLFKSKFDEYEQISASYENISQNLKHLKTYEKTEQELINEINELNILQNIYQEEIINIINDILEFCEINPEKISFSEIYTVNINEMDNEEFVADNAGIEIIEAEAMTVNIEFSSTYDSLVSFIDEIQNFDKDIIISNIRIIKHEEGEDILCIINLSFYALPMREKKME